MFDERKLDTILRLHEQSYELLKLVKAALKQGTVSFGVLHNATDSATAAAEWVHRHLANIPVVARPEPDEVPLFSRLFVSFLQTSFNLKANTVVRTTTYGCCCGFCTTLRMGPNLVPRTPSKRDFETARELKRLYLQRLADDIQATVSSQVASRLLADQSLRELISMATWGAELVRRSQFASQGEAALALWREFAWKDKRISCQRKISWSQPR